MKKTSLRLIPLFALFLLGACTSADRTGVMADMGLSDSPADPPAETAALAPQATLASATQVSDRNYGQFCQGAARQSVQGHNFDQATQHTMYQKLLDQCLALRTTPSL